VFASDQELRDERILSRRLIQALERNAAEHGREAGDDAVDLQHEDFPGVSPAVLQHRVEVVRGYRRAGTEPAVDRPLGVLELRDAVA
jgi:hypothetical protein